MKKIIQISFVSIVLLALFFPIMKFNKNGTVSANENRTLATKPEFSFLNFASYDDYLKDRFGGRDRLIKIANFVDYKIFNKQIKTAKAFEGKDGWLYYIDKNDGYNLSDFYKINLLDENAKPVAYGEWVCTIAFTSGLFLYISRCIFTSEDGFPLVNTLPFISTNTISSSDKSERDFRVGVIATISLPSFLNLALMLPDFPETSPLS